MKKWKNQAQNSSRKRPTRYRNFSAIVYDDSAPSNWKDILALQLVPAFISPVHDGDIDGDGKPKKPHYHVILMFSTVKEPCQAEIVFNAINAIRCEPVHDLRAASRYLCHLEAYDKTLYSINDVISLNGADYSGVINLITDKMKSYREMQQYCEENAIISFASFCTYCAKYEAEWYRLIVERPYFMKEFIKSRWLELYNAGRLD